MNVLIVLAILAIQAPDTAALHRAAAAIRPGTTVRLQLVDGQRWIGTFQSAAADGIVIADSVERRRIALESVTRFWERKRAIPAGATVGGIIGAGTGAFFGLLVAGLCDSGDCPTIPRGIAVGTLLGAGLGAGGGTIIGAAIPRWSQRYRYRGPPAAGTPAPEIVPGGAAVPPTPRRRIGEFTIMGVAGHGGLEFDDPFFATSYRHGFLFGAEAGLGFRAGRLALGPEGSIMRGEQELWSLGGMIRLALRDDHQPGLVPHVLAGLGPHGWSAGTAMSTALTLTVGGGVTTSAGWRLEGRLQQSVQNDFQKPRLISVAVGRRFIW